MISEFVNNLDYLLVIVIAIILYRWIGRPLAFKL